MEINYSDVAEFAREYWPAFAAGLGGLILGFGYRAVSNRGKLKKYEIRQRDLENKRMELDNENKRLALDTLNADNERLRLQSHEKQIEIMKIAEQYKEAQHRRDLEVQERKRREYLEDEERERRYSLEDEQRNHAYEADNNDRRQRDKEAALAKLEGMRPMLEEAIQARNRFLETDYRDILGKREKFREEILGEHMAKLRENYSPDDGEYDISDEVRQKIERLTAAKYPLTVLPELPQEVITLFDSLQLDEESEYGKILKKRQEFYEELIDKFLGKLNEDCSITDDDYKIEDDDIERINTIVDVRYPLPASAKPRPEPKTIDSTGA